MVFKAKNAHTFKLRVTLADRRSAICSTGTTDKRVAEDVEGMVKRFRRLRRWDVLEAIVLKQVTLAKVYDADQAGTLDALMAELTDVDLDPLVTEWSARAIPKYVRQVRRFIPEGKRFLLSRFSRKAISAFLAALPVDDPTRNRYRAALSVFARWLVEREILETNVVRDVKMYKEHDPRMVWMTWQDAERVAAAAPEPVRSLLILMAATGMEWGAAKVLTAADFNTDERRVWARGSKNRWRHRVVRYEPFADAAVARLLDGKLGHTRLFPGIKHKDTLAAFRNAQKAVGIEGHTLHDLRHTYAVNGLKIGHAEQAVAHQLGHKNTNQVRSNYGRYIPDDRDYAATNPATTDAKKGQVRRAK
jgi:integrase